MKKFTTSWDDGHPHDLKVAELLDKYSKSGIFYIPIKNSEGRKVMSKREIFEISRKFEIGGHTYSHADLVNLPVKKAIEEIQDGKKALEQIIGRKVIKFAYPRGHYNGSLKKIVEEAGFTQARTARMFALKPGSDKYALHPNLHFYPHHLQIYLAHCLKNKDLQSFLVVPKTFSTSPAITAKKLKRYVSGSEFHIWGHSWELEEQNLFRALKIFLNHAEN